MTRRCKGLQHTILTQDSILDDCYPENMTREVFIKDCEKSVNTAEVHSDKWSTEDKVLANEECNDNIRSGRLISTNSVIKIHNKKWRLKESYFERMRLEPIQDTANWWILSRWIEPESDDDDDDEDNDDDNNDDDNNGNDDNNDDNNNGNSNNNNDSNNGNADKNDGTNEE
ncbi:hypothetical protein RclHR1_04870018 [Rhizophagus clarus]|uniref:Uncharacterized protein n=1 Tax=Rhizophagus clarus TaxID=94130 RepID=A0A2Z6RWU5_9GLOM|nr:hypothetical protein RclHR1_04870018 [Rhizophagus clarus]